MPRGKKTASASNGAAVSKWDAVKESLADLGNDAMPLELQVHIKKKYSIDMPTTLISTYKSNLLKGGGKKQGRRKRKGRRAAAPAKRTSAAGGISVDDIKAVRLLVDRMGADKVQELAQVLAK